MGSAFRGAVSNVRHWCGFVLGLWSRHYKDSRIILEQGGDLRYLVVSARFQKNLARSVLVLVGSMLVLLVGLTFSTVYLHAQKLLLENSHRQIYMALQSAGLDSSEQVGDYSQQDMLEMAQVIRDRDMQIRQYVGDWTDRLAYRNDQLRGLMKSSGLNEKVIAIIQNTQSVGGFNEGIKSNPLLNTAFANETSTNKELTNVLSALPARMPLDDYSVTSEFGIRNHPVTQKPTLHAGIDLTPQGASDAVRAVKAGKVLIARYHGNLGNTVIVRHERGVETLYGHLDKIFVKEGEEVAEGKVLGTVGNTGQSTGKHLHFEVLIGSYQVDPKKVVQTAQHVRKIEK